MTWTEALHQLGCTCEGGPDLEVVGGTLDIVHEPDCFRMITTAPELAGLWSASAPAP